MLMRSIALFVILFLMVNCTSGQNLVGYGAKDIVKYMKENHKNMQNISVANTLFKYLKYSDIYDHQTLLFFLTPDSVCNHIRMICDPGIKKDKVGEFNSLYRRISESKWIDKRRGKEYLIEITDEQWSFVVSIGLNG